MGPEPELLTHREPDYDGGVHNDPGPADLAGTELDDELDKDGPLTNEDRRKRRKKVWRRVRRSMYVLVALMIIGPMVAFVIAYQYVQVPDPVTVANAQGQVATLMYADQQTPMAKIYPAGGENRVMVKYQDLKANKNVLNAVFAAEDAEFMTNPGFDITGVMQAGWNQVTGGSGGGSTITQQYIKKATGDDDASGLSGYTRKALEVVKAYKMNNTYSKEDIITAYLNTVYFGRGAYGISAAAKAYYGQNKQLKDLTASESALLAGMIQSPSRFDDQEYMERRWNFVLDQMVNRDWFPAEKRKAEPFPEMVPLKDARPDAPVGPDAHIQAQVLKELEGLGFDENAIHKHGYIIETTVHQGIQAKAQQAVQDVLYDPENPQPENLRPGLVAVNPKNGDVLAYYGGYDGLGTDWAAARQEPGSSFKPFDLVALLQMGEGLGKTYDGTTPRTFDGRQVRNSGGASCGKKCPVSEAMRKSINTVFYDMALNDTTTQKVADAAHAAGITSPLESEGGGAPDANISIGGGKTQVSTTEMASAYATFAAGGIHRTPHFVNRVLYPDGEVAWKRPDPSQTGEAAFDKDDPENNQKIARNVTESLIPVLEYSKLECAKGRECAGKTGTHQYGATEENSKAWMVGYTPSVSTAVSMSDDDVDPIVNADGEVVYGSGLPGEIWKTFMDSYLDGTEKEDFGKFEPIGKGPSKGEESTSGKPSDTGGQTTTPTTTETTPTTTSETTTTDDDWPLPGDPPGQPGAGQPPGRNNDPE